MALKLALKMALKLALKMALKLALKMALKLHAQIAPRRPNMTKLNPNLGSPYFCKFWSSLGLWD